MATRTPKQAKPATTAAQAPSAMQQAAAALAAPAQPSTPPAVAGAPATPVLPVAVVVGGQQVAAARNVLARSATLGNVPSALAGVRLTTGPVVCRVRVPYTQQCWAQVQAHLAQHGPATGATLAGVSTGDFVKYAVKNRWLAAASA